MKKLLLTSLILICASPLTAATMNYAAGFYVGFMPSYGGNLESSTQYDPFDSRNGIDGMNKEMSGHDTTEIKRLLGLSGGIEFKAIIFDYFLMRLAGNYTMSIYGGAGKTVFLTGGAGTETDVTASYSMWSYDIPLTVGLIIPFWKDVKISFSCGLAFAYGAYDNQFKVASGDRKGSFTGWALPLVILVQGEYFLGEKIALNTSLAYYKGATETIRDSKRSDTTGLGGAGAVDFAKIDFTGYRFSIGLSYYFYSI
ncbi:MAG: hypothetical protein EPN93_02095 [Spirochaetes bacterium]|nr:MAG: hypothetical protein EPN93_02095 [Spirochaetota bacterium]